MSSAGAALLSGARGHLRANSARALPLVEAETRATHPARARTRTPNCCAVVHFPWLFSSAGIDVGTVHGSWQEHVLQTHVRHALCSLLAIVRSDCAQRLCACARLASLPTVCSAVPCPLRTSSRTPGIRLATFLPPNAAVPFLCRRPKKRRRRRAADGPLTPRAWCSCGCAWCPLPSWTTG